MRVTLKSTASWSSLGWLMPLAFLALPDCGFQSGTSCLDGNTNVQAGCHPRSGALFCDIEKVLLGNPHCASDREIEHGIRRTQAAVALTRNQKSNIVLDYSPAAIQAQGCTDGRPVAVVYECPFPDGCPVCVNCSNYAPSDVNAVCAAKCEDLFDLTLQPDGKLRPGVPPDPLTVAFCEAHARASTNAGTTCFADACMDAGTEDVANPAFVDPRRDPEKVEWRDLLGVSASGNTLTRTEPDTGGFDRGAASVQSITTGDGYVEFTVTETNLGRAFGLSSGAADDNDLDRTLAGIGFAVRLGAAGGVFVSQSGTPAGDPNVPLAQYSAGDRIRVTVTDNLDDPHTASIAYYLIPESCAGPHCEGMPLLPPPYTSAPYPFRADASIRHQGGTLTDVRIVRIK